MQLIFFIYCFLLQFLQNLQQQTTAVPRGIKCGSFSQNYRDFIIDLTSLANTCAKIENQRPSAEQRLNSYIDNVRQSMIAESSRRYTLYNIKLSMDSTLTPEQRQKKREADRAVIDPAMQEFNNLVDNPTTGIKKNITDLIRNLAPTSTESCLGAIQNLTMTQVTNAAALISIPPQLCIDMQESYKNFTNALNGVYHQIGVTIPM